MGLDYYWKNDQDRAIENYNMSLRYTKLKATYRRLGISYLKKGMNDEALREFRRARIGEDE
jgi:tetratricopeptide (TPR) repeat protein